MCRLSKESINCFTERAVEERILIPLRLNSRVSFVPVNLFRSNFYYNLYLPHLTNQNSPKFIYIHIKIHLVASYEMKTENLKTSRCKQRVGKRGEAKERERSVFVYSLSIERNIGTRGHSLHTTRLSMLSFYAPCGHLLTRINNIYPLFRILIK